jgi:NADH-quinone oxidoreductase subunit I
VSSLASALLVDLIIGLKTTFIHLFRPADTVEYPEKARTPSDRFRGMFLLDEDRCIKCTLCAIECPINIIYIDWHSEKNEAGKNEKVLDRFDLDLKRCMFCGLCEEACPTKPKSIWLTTKTYELSTYERNDALYLDIKKLTKWDHNVKPFVPREARHEKPVGKPPEPPAAMAETLAGAPAGAPAGAQNENKEKSA